MIEIAISLGIIGFALVTIVGLLPMGLNVQRDNREDTIISQDGNFFIEAIRGGVVGLDLLTNYVERIVVSNFPWGASAVNSYVDYSVLNGGIKTGADVIELLSIPKYAPDTKHPNRVMTNVVIAYFRSLSGSALMQGQRVKDDEALRSMSFVYQLRPEVTAFNGWDRESTNFTGPVTNYLTADELLQRQERWEQVRYLTNTLYDVRLRFAWPVVGNARTNTGNVVNFPKFQVFRTQISAVRDSSGIFNPQTYQYP